jgi:hypothetical protein
MALMARPTPQTWLTEREALAVIREEIRGQFFKWMN